MKKLIALILALCMLLALAACAPSETKNEEPKGETKESNETGSTETSDGIDVDENLLTVDITLPASMFDGEDMSSFDAETYAKEQGFVKAVLNEDGSVSVTINKVKYNEMLKELAASVEEAFSGMIEAESSPYIKEIVHNDDFSAVTVKVDRAGYESAIFEMTPLLIGMSAMMYQAFVDMEAVCVVTIVDVSNGDTINTVTYPIAE